MDLYLHRTSTDLLVHALTIRRHNGLVSSSYFNRPARPFFVDVAADTGDAACHQRRPSRRETSTDDVLGARHDQLQQQFHETLLRVERMMRWNDARSAERDRQTIVRVEWQLVATVVDRILLVIFVATTVGVTLDTERELIIHS